MANVSTLHDALINELRDLYNAEKQITRALPKMSKAATTPPLVDAFDTHLDETLGQIERLERVFESLGESARGKQCEGIAGILEEGKQIMDEDFDELTLDACLIAAAQRVEHYEIAAYGTAVAWAKAMGHEEAANLLHESLEEEKAADEKLTSIAKGGVNEQAASGAHTEEDQEQDEAEDQTEEEGGQTKGARSARAGSRRVAKPATTR